MRGDRKRNDANKFGLQRKIDRPRKGPTIIAKTTPQVGIEAHPAPIRTTRMAIQTVRQIAKLARGLSEGGRSRDCFNGEAKEFLLRRVGVVVNVTRNVGAADTYLNVHIFSNLVWFFPTRKWLNGGASYKHHLHTCESRAHGVSNSLC